MVRSYYFSKFLVPLLTFIRLVALKIIIINHL